MACQDGAKKKREPVAAPGSKWSKGLDLELATGDAYDAEQASAEEGE